jgi:hypothetical protein
MEQPLDIQDVRVVHFGLGPLGAAIARTVAAREGLTSVAAIDTVSSREGRDLADVAGLGGSTGIVVEGSPSRLHDLEADVVLFAPDDDLDVAISDLELLLEVGLNVVTVFPELAYPPDDEEDELAASIDTLAREAEVTALALDPSDALFGPLPLVLTGVCASVDRVTIRRHGASAAAGRLSVGDWVRALAGSLGWNLDDLDETEAAPGGAHRIVGSVRGSEVLVVEVLTSGGAPRLDVVVEGSPSLTLSVDGGENPDQLLANLAVNAIPAVLTGDPGLYTIADLPPVHSWTSLGLMPADDDEDEDE